MEVGDSDKSDLGRAAPRFEKSNATKFSFWWNESKYCQHLGSLCWMWMSLNQVNKAQSSYNNQFLISCWVPQINLCSKEKGWSLIWVTIIGDFVKYERSRDGRTLNEWVETSVSTHLLHPYEAEVVFIKCVYQTVIAIRHQWWMQISIKIIKVFCQAKLRGVESLRIPSCFKLENQ